MAAIYQHAYGFRHKSEWGAGPDDAPYAEGDIVFIPADSPAHESGRLEAGPGVYRVVSSFSIAEGPEWYFRVSRMTPTGKGDRWRTEGDCSGRLHVIPGGPDYSEGWVLLHPAAMDNNRQERGGEPVKHRRTTAVWGRGKR